MKRKILTVSFLLLALCVMLSSCGIFDEKPCEHTYADRVVPPTCTEEGYTEHVCTKCNSTYSDSTVEKLPHVYVTTVVPPTCTAEGYNDNNCTECGHNYKDVFTQKVIHPYKSIVVSPTCSTEGYTEHICLVCNDSYKDAITPTIPHTYEEEIISPTCSTEGYTLHTCTECGDNYNDTSVARLPHTYGDEVIAPTCVEEGYTKHTCVDCGDTYNDTVTAKTAHRFNGASCIYCSMEEITENITPDTEWYTDDKTAFLISTPAQLAGFSSLVNSGNSFSGKSVYLDSDIDLGYAEWIPIGTEDNPFAGSFSGEGYSIYGLKINVSTAYAGLFGNSKCKITNLNVTNATVYSGDNYNYVSIVCGYSEGEISEISVSGYVDAKICSYVAGIVGFTSAIIKNCANNAEIVADGYVGGIAGLCSNDISYCTNNGRISGKSSYVGGIAGEFNSDIERSHKNLTNTADINGLSHVAGIFGRFVNQLNKAGVTWYSDVKKGSHWHASDWICPLYNHYYYATTSMENIANYGNVVAREHMAGGIIGGMSIVNNYTSKTGCHCDRSSCSIIGDVRLVATNFTNSGEVSGAIQVGELFGYFNSDAPSTVTTYTIVGQVSVSGEKFDGDYSFGEKSNITLSDRVIPETEVPEIDGDENTETGEAE